MRVPLSWLAEYVDLPGDATADSVMTELVKVGLEEEGEHGFDVLGPLVVGQVLEFVDEPQSNGKTIRWCQVQVAPLGELAADGGKDIRGIVCGASNFEVGDKVVVSLPGATLPGNFVISARSTYGHISDGMMASAKELNLSEDHSGIIRLHEMGLDPKVGSDAVELLCIGDTAAEINVTPDRGYCFSIRGVAREFSHATGGEFRDPTGFVHLVHGHGFGLEIRDDAPIRGKSASQKFVLRSVVGIAANKPTPAWMRSRLKLAGMRSISLAVDITNYVMLEMGQPVHAYDLDKVQGGIVVRRAKAGETLKTLDGQIRKLHVEDLVITDDSGPIGLAGVMGGESTEVSESTVNVLIEAAHFEPVSISRSARRHKLPSEASKRYERGVDPLVAEYAAARVIQLLEVHADGTAGDLGAEYTNLEEPKPIWLPMSFASELVGVDYSSEEIQKVLNEIGANVEVKEDGFEVLPPSWRPDITHKTDLVEEVARISGYDKIPSRIPVAPPGRGLTRFQQYRRSALNSLAASGHVEVLTYPFVSMNQNGYFSSLASSSLKLANPMQEESSYMRLSLLPGLIDAAKRNHSRGMTDLYLVEEGSVFFPAPSLVPVFPDTNTSPTADEVIELKKTIPAQPHYLSGLFTGNRIAQQPGKKTEPVNFEDAIQSARLIAHCVGLEIIVKQSTTLGFHPGRTAELYVLGSEGEISVGFAGELDPSISKENDLPRTVGVFEINLSALYALAPSVKGAKTFGTLPAATQDLSLVVSLAVPAQEVLQAVREGAGDLLEEIILTDDYRGENLPEGSKSLTFALRFRALDRTLTQAEASEARDNGVALAREKYKAEIRA
jgi:phenylalanyl-tRNA synthetase beta chain